ncbi:hypothetical protein GCM10027341_53690 [Spirosoma knui]
MNRTKKITIITATYNAERFLQQSIESVLSQNFSNIEYIIIDGGSTDQTVDIIKRNSSKITYWISETDKGIYDAWNKGISRATGEWIMFLGSDDLLLPGALAMYVNFIGTLPADTEYVSSRVQMADEELNPTRVKGWHWEWPRFLKDMTVAHPGSLHACTLFQKYGMFNTDYKIVGDYELLLRPGKALKAAYIDATTVIMREGGASDSWAAIQEHYQASTLTGKSPVLPASANMYYVGLKFCTKKILHSIGVNAYLRR